jgi:hypothetical protein
VQKNRFEVVVWAFARGEEMWTVDYQLIGCAKSAKRTYRNRWASFVSPSYGPTYTNAFRSPRSSKPPNWDSHDDLLQEEHERIKQQHVIYQAAADFLAKEGIIRFGGQAKGQPMFSSMVLTSKGLSILQRTPAVISEKHTQTLGNKLAKQG